MSVCDTHTILQRQEFNGLVKERVCPLVIKLFSPSSGSIKDVSFGSPVSPPDRHNFPLFVRLVRIVIILVLDFFTNLVRSLCQCSHHDRLQPCHTVPTVGHRMRDISIIVSQVHGRRQTPVAADTVGGSPRHSLCPRAHCRVSFVHECGGMCDSVVCGGWM